MTTQLRLMLSDFASRTTKATVHVRRTMARWVPAFVSRFCHFIQPLVPLPPNMCQLVLVRKVEAHRSVISFFQRMS